MSYLDQIIQNTLDASERKKQRLEETAARKKREMDPSYRSLESGKYRVIDGDTIWDENLQREIRVAGLAGSSPDTFESDESKYYDKDGNLTDRFHQHKRAYEQMFDKKDGLLRKSVTAKQLADMGRVQGQRLADELYRREQAGESLDYQVTGIDDYGRATGVFGGQYFEDLSKRENNANYFSKYNNVQKVQDVLSGVETEDHKTRGGRGIGRATADQAVNFGIGALNMLNEFGQAANAIDTIKNRVLQLDHIPGVGATNEAVNNFFSNNKKVFDRWKQHLTSDAQTRSEERAGRESLFNEELYALNVRDNMKQGMTESAAKFNASMSEAGNTIRNLAQSPGRVIDMTFESLPYMMGIAGVGRAAISGALKSQAKKITQEMLEHGASGEMISASVSRYMASEAGKEALQKIGSRTGTAAIGVSEGLSTGAAVYDRVMGMTEQEAMESEKYQALRFDKEMSHEEALSVLAQETFMQTTAWTMLLAGAAGKVTGAADWEARLLTRLADTRAVVANATKEGVERTIKQRALAATTETGKYIGRRAVPAAKEAGEEALQSGGSEGISAVQLQDAGFGDGLGAGLAEAAVTGAASGAASGGGVSTVVSAAKSLGEGLTKLHEVSTTGDSYKTGVLKAIKGMGGSTQATVDNAQRVVKDEDVLKAIDDVLASPGDENASFEQMTHLKYLREEATARGITLDKDLEDKLNVYEQDFQNSIADTLKQAANDDSIDEKDVDTLIYWAGQYDLPIPKELNQSDNQTKIYNMSKAVSKALTETHGAISDTVKNMPDTDKQKVDGKASDAETTRVYNEKLGTGIGETGPGMALHARMMAEAIRDGDMKAAEKHYSNVNNFQIDQAHKVDVLERMIVEAEKGNFDEADRIGLERKKGDDDFGVIKVQNRNNPAHAVNSLKKLHRQAVAEQQILEPLAQGIRDAYDSFSEDTSSPDNASAETASQDESGDESPRDSDSGSAQVAGDPDAQDSPIPDSAEGQEPSNSATSDTDSGTPADTDDPIPVDDGPEAPSEPVGDDSPPIEDDGPPVDEFDDSRPPEAFDDNFPPQYDDHPPPDSYDDTENWEPTDEDEAWAARYEEESPFHTEEDMNWDPTEEPREIWDQEVDDKTADEFADAADKILNDGEVPSRAQEAVDNGADLSRTRQSQMRNVGQGQEDVNGNKTGGSVYDTKDDADTRAEKIGRRLVLGFKLPVKLSNVLEAAGETTNNMLSAVSNFHRAFLNGQVRAKLADKLGLDEKQTAAMEGMASFMGHFTTQLNRTRLQWMGKGGKERTMDNNFIWRSKGSQAVRGLRQYGLQYFYDRLGNLHPNVEAAMALAGYQWLATQGAGGIQNEDSRINFLLGRDENTEVTDAERAQFGRGTPKAVVAQAIGQQVLKSLGLREKNAENLNIDSLFIARLESSIGNMVLGTMTDMGSIESVVVQGAAMQKAQSRDPDKTVDEIDGTVDFVFAKSDKQDDGSYVLSSEANQVVTDYAQNAVTLEKLFGFPDTSRPPTFEEPGDDQISKKYGRSETAVPETLRERIAKMQARPVHTNRDLLNMAKVFGREDFAEKILGAPTQAQVDAAHDDNRTSLQGQRDQALRSYDEAVRWDEEAEGREFYFTYNVTSTGRINMSSNTINPQNNTMHRWMYRMQEWTTEVPVNPTTAEEQRTLENFKIAVGLGMDIDFSKYTRKGVLDQVDKMIEYAEESGVLDAVNRLTNDEVIDGDLDLIAEWVKGIKITADGNTKEVVAKYGGEGMHSLAALKSLAGWHASTDTYITTLPAETDGKTNGFSAGGLQTPGFWNDPDTGRSAKPGRRFGLVKQMLAATGVFFEDTVLNGRKITSYPIFSEMGGRDNYNQIADKTATNINDMVTGKVTQFESILKEPGELAPRWMHIEYWDGIGIRQVPGKALNAVKALGVVEIDRNFAKGPLTVVAYMGGMRGVKWAMVNKAVKELYKNLDKTKNFEELAVWHNRVADATNVGLFRLHGKSKGEMPKVTADSLRKDANGKSFENYRKHYKLSPKPGMDAEFKEALGRAIYHTYGHALEAALTQQMEPFTEIRQAINEVFSAANEIFAADFRQRLADLEERTGQEANPRQRREILQQMIKDGAVPAVRSPLSESHLDAIQITKNGRIYMKKDDTFRNRGAAHYNTSEVRHTEAFDKDGNPTEPRATGSSGSPLSAFDPDPEIGVAGLVKLIHSTDGAVNSKVFGDFPIMNIHDAQLGGINQIDEVAAAANEEFFRLHREYNIGQEVAEALDRQVQKVEEYYAGRDDVGAQRVLVQVAEKADNKDINEARGVIKQNTFTKNKLFERIRWVNQFAKDGTEVPVNQGGANSSPDPEQQVLDRTVRDIQAAAANPYADPVATFLDTVRSENLSPAQLVEALGSYLEGRMEQEARETLMSVLKNISENLPGDTRIALTTDIASDAAAQFDAESNTIFLNPKPVATTFSEFLHEMNHAALVPQIVEMANDPNRVDEFNALFEEAKEFFKAGLKSRDPYLIAAAKDVQAKNNVGTTVVEYLAYATTGLRPTASGLVAPVSNNGSFQRASQTIDKLVNKDARPGKGSLGSSQRPVQRDGLQNERQFTLTADTFQSIMDTLTGIEGLGALSPEAREMLGRLIKDHVLPALKDIDAVTVTLGTNPNGTRNVGEILDDGSIYLEAAPTNQLVPGGMSLQEAFTHEVVHAITRRIVDDSPAIRNKAQKLFDRAAEVIKSGNDLLVDPANASTQERAEAQSLYEYLFNNPNQRVGEDSAPRYIHEFLALATTNHGLASALKKIEVKPDVREPATDLFTWAANILADVFTYLATALRGPKSNKLSDNVQALMVDISNIRREQETRTRYINQKANEVADWSDEFVLETASRLTKSLRVWASKQNKPSNFQRKPVQALKAMTLDAMQADIEGTRQVLEEFFAETRKDTWYSEILSEVMPYPEKNKSWISMLRKSQVAIDMARQAAIEHTREGLLGAFDKAFKMKPKHREAITYAILDTDLGALLRDNFMSLGQIMDIMGSSQSRVNAIKRLEAAIQDELANDGLGSDRKNREFTEWIDSQVEGLAEFMVDGTIGKSRQLLNAHNIVKQVGVAEGTQRPLSEDPAQVERLIGLVDKLATIKAVGRQKSEHISLALEVVQHEMNRGVTSNGFERLLGESIAFTDESLGSLFDNKRYEMVKGYTQDIYDDNLDMAIKPHSEKTRREMEAKGYKFKHILAKDPDDPGPQMAAYVSARGIAGYNKAVVSLTNPRRMGTDIFEGISHMYADKKWAAQQAHNETARIRNKHFAAGFKRENNADGGTFMVPLIGPDGTVKSYRYVMSEASKRDLLKKRNYFDEVFPAQVGSIIDRTKSKDINRETVDLLKEEWEMWAGNNEDGTPKSHSRFKVIGPYAKDKDAREMWRLLPDDMKAAARDAFGSDRIIVREEAVNLVLGFRKLSLAQGKAGEFFGPTAPLVKIAESVWQESLQFLRFKIAITTPRVVLGNIVSNTAVLLTEGIPPDYIKQKSQEGIVNMRKYQKEKRNRDILERSIKSDEALGKNTTSKRAKLARLDEDLRTNPVALLVKEGLFTSIVEDLGYDEQRTSTRLVNKGLNKITAEIPGFVTTIAKEGYMVPGSKTANAALIATQLGDFTARYVKLHYDMNVKGKSLEQSINESLSTFIYYNMPQNKYLQWANDNGAMMFTKFFLRSQHVTARLFVNNPARAATLLVAQKHLLSNIDPMLGENIANYAGLQGATNKFEILPYRHFTGENGNAIWKPAMLDWLELFGIGGD